MFIQVIQGKVADRARLEERMRLWETEVRPGAIGFLGSTSGITEDGTCIVLARFDSAESAQANGDRPEQSAWWAETATCFDGEPTFMDCTNIYEWMGGGSNEAHFVQIMEGRTTDVQRLAQVLETASDRVHELRPEILGGRLMQVSDSGDYVEAIYFTDEAAARRGEQLEIPDDLRSLMEEDRQLGGDVAFFDLREPVLLAAK